jgi:hypothetical protein
VEGPFSIHGTLRLWPLTLLYGGCANRDEFALVRGRNNLVANCAHSGTAKQGAACMYRTTTDNRYTSLHWRSNGNMVLISNSSRQSDNNRLGPNFEQKCACTTTTRYPCYFPWRVAQQTPPMETCTTDDYTHASRLLNDSRLCIGIGSYMSVLQCHDAASSGPIA